MTTVSVECTFAADGRVQVRRVEVDGRWLTVEQGRQWLDQTGRHVLVMVPGRPVKELVLRPESLTWELVNGHNSIHLI